MITTCIICGKERRTFPSRVKRGWGKYCSVACADLGKIGNSGWWTGKKRPDITGDNNVDWKGNNVGYSRKHKWIARLLGKPFKCEYSRCLYPRNILGTKRVILKPARFEWANISGKYKRDVSDWIQLCASCHRRYDHGKLVL